MEKADHIKFRSTPNLHWPSSRTRRVLWTGVILLCSTFLTLSLLVRKTRILLPVSPNGTISFDNYSLIINGQRVFLHSGEFHPFRLPVVPLWLDIIQKAKAAGLNSLSIYTHMGLLNPAPGVIDMDGWRSLEPLYTAAVHEGLWLVMRPGPYINAEVSAGGLGHWVTSEVPGHLRSNESAWKSAWIPYMQAFADATAPWQVTRGGPVVAVQIDNEYWQDESTSQYFQDVKDLLKARGIDVPLTYNDARPGKNFINGTGAADIYGLDSYPQRFDCSNPSTWNPIRTNYHDYHMEANPSQPWYIPEFQAGSFDAWGPNSPGYDGCYDLTNPAFMSVFNLQLWSSNAKMINYYMFFGGTSWGGLPFPGVYTSYDYGAAVQENRILTRKYDELKRQALFIRSSPEFYKTQWIADSSTGLNVLSDPRVFATLLSNPDTGADFYVLRQAKANSTSTLHFKMNITSDPATVASLALEGRESKVVVTNYHYGHNLASIIHYSTAQIYFAGTISGRDVILFFGKTGQQYEVLLPKHLGGWLLILPGTQGLVTIWDDRDHLVLYADEATVATFWAPLLSAPSPTPFANFWSIGTNETILLGGPYLVRSASLSPSLELDLIGDLKEGVRLILIGPPKLRMVRWNGIDVIPDLTLSGQELEKLPVGTFVGKLSARLTQKNMGFDLPKLGPWRYRDSLPEIQPGFVDTEWAVANRTGTNIPFKMKYGDGRVLYGCDYGFCENTVLWRGHFIGSTQTTSVNLSINGGEAFAASIWLNDVFLGTAYGNSTNNLNIIEETDEIYTFPSSSIRIAEDNVITILQDNMGMDESEDEGLGPDASRSPRGVRGFKLNDGTFGEWKVQGKIGGYNGYPDKHRGILNEGGLFAERLGWHLPGYDTRTSAWVSRDNLSLNVAGVGFFVCEVELDVPEYLDSPMSVVFREPFGQPFRALLFVNGWMMGKRVGNLGPQSRFPVPQGILDYKGKNTIAVAVWAMENQSILPEVELVVDAVIDGGVPGGVRVDQQGWVSSGRYVS
ncbi:glycoside hydrolase family 35 protein [Flagelloscypha sp. PMI_526]|nr:glycoside hydrolase family 35 protein [Flagelloscypha sp. PMI_526]